MRTARQRTIVRTANETQSLRAPLFKSSLKQWQAAWKAKQQLRRVLEGPAAEPVPEADRQLQAAR